MRTLRETEVSLKKAALRMRGKVVTKGGAIRIFRPTI